MKKSTIIKIFCGIGAVVASVFAIAAFIRLRNDMVLNEIYDDLEDEWFE